MLSGGALMRQGGKSGRCCSPRRHDDKSVCFKASCGPMVTVVHWYHNESAMRVRQHHKKFVIERVQTGVRMEKRLLKVLKGLAEFHDLTLGDLLEGIVLHAFDGKTAFQKPSRKRIKELKRFYGLDLDSRASHRLTEARELGRPQKVRIAPSRRRAKAASSEAKKAPTRPISRSVVHERVTKRKRRG